MLSAVIGRRIHGYAVSIVGVAAVAVAVWVFYPNIRGITVSNALLLAVVFFAVRWGMGPALVAALLGFTYLIFIYFEQRIADINLEPATPTEFVVALLAFLGTSVLIAQLSGRAQQRTREVQYLYDQLRAAFERASQLEAVKQSEQFKSALLDTVTHDLRTPLTSIKAAATAMVERQSNSGADGRSEDHLPRIITEQCDRLNRFIDSMIELARLQSATEEAEGDSVLAHVEEIVVAAIARAEDRLRERDVEVQCEEDLVAAVNPKAVAQVVFSLLENAARFAPRGTTIRIIAGRDEAGQVRIAVEDEGPGVPMELRTKIFEKFFRAEMPEPRPRDTAGLGLGLAIARGIVEAHNGKIWVEDRTANGSGARFVFVLPANAQIEAELTDSEAVLNHERKGNANSSGG